MLGFAVAGELAFELGHVGAEDEVGVRHHLVERGLHLGGDRRVLGLQINER